MNSDPSRPRATAIQVKLRAAAETMAMATLDPTNTPSAV